MSSLPTTKHGNNSVFMVVERFLNMAIMAAFKKNITIEATVNSSLNESGYTLESHNLSSEIGTKSSSVNFGLASSQSWTPSSPSPQLFIPKLMPRKRSSTRWSYTLCACKTQSIHAHRMRASPMYNTSITHPSTIQPAIAPFRWPWDLSHYVPFT